MLRFVKSLEVWNYYLKLTYFHVVGYEEAIFFFLSRYSVSSESIFDASMKSFSVNPPERKKSLKINQYTGVFILPLQNDDISCLPLE